MPYKNYANFLVQKYGKEARWVNWKKEVVDGKETKVPYCSKSNRASSTNPDTWKTYEECAIGFDNGSNEFSGIGIVLHDGRLLCIDVDHVLLDGILISQYRELVEALIKKADTFTEKSQSGTGLHLFFELEEPYTPVRNKIEPFEVYTNGRYIATTGDSYHDNPKEVRTVTVKELEEILQLIGFPTEKQSTLHSKMYSIIHQTFTDQQLLEKMFESKNGDKIWSLYNGDISLYHNDDSSADMALLSHLAFWTGKNESQMERIWLASPLGQREKTKNRKDYVDRTIASAISKCTNTYESKKQKAELGSQGSVRKDSKDSLMIKYICERKDVILFHDEKGETYISLDNDGHRENWLIKSRNMRLFLNNKSWNTFGGTLKSEEAKNIIGVLQAKAHFEGPEIKLHNRVAWNEGSLYYDLTNPKYQAVRINENGWEIIDKTPIIFKRYPHQKAQFLPVHNGDIRRFLNYINIENPEHRLLFLVLFVSYFIPDFPHAMMVIFGAQGASKTTTAKMVRLGNDPSIMEVSSIANNLKELVQELAHHHLVFFDNVSYISEDVSDIFCKAISGGGFSKRELYSDDEDIIYTIERCIGINGINLVTTRPDLLDRSVLIELQRLDESKRKSEKELYENFEKDLPSILGGVFDVIVEAIKRRPNIEVRPERMADFTYWGCAIAEALGYTKEDFMTAYKNNTLKQTEMLLNDNVVATAIIQFMEGKEEWKNTPTKLLNELYSQAFFANIDTREKYWPKGASALSRRLNELSTSLKQMGISVVISTHGTERYIHIQKIPKVVSDDTDDVYGDIW